MHPVEHDRYSERRRFRRVPVHARCWCEAEAITLYAQIVNVSEQGMFVRTFAPLKVGSVVALKFSLSSRSEVNATAVVVWARASANAFGEPAGMGLLFSGIEEDSLGLLRGFIHATPASSSES